MCCLQIVFKGRYTTSTQHPEGHLRVGYLAYFSVYIFWPQHYALDNAPLSAAGYRKPALDGGFSVLRGRRPS